MTHISSTDNAWFLFFMIIAGLDELDALCVLEYMRQITLIKRK